MLKASYLALAAVSLAAGSALAAPADEARAHFQAIAAGDVPAVMSGYAEQVQFHWVGGRWMARTPAPTPFARCGRNSPSRRGRSS